MEALLTGHAKERGRERIGLNAKALSRLTQHAMERGREPSEFAGSFRRFLDAIAIKGCSVVRVHGEFAYVFATDGHLKTVLAIPPKFRRQLRRMKEHSATH